VCAKGKELEDFSEVMGRNKALVVSGEEEVALFVVRD
jgi:hypothetical protein